MNAAISLKQLWLGQLPLREAFWRYAITYDLVLNIAATIAALAFILSDTPIAIAVIVHFLPLPYSLFAATGAWRSANSYQGNSFHVTAAKFALILWIGFWLIF
jgi:hypothetical protein